MRILVFSDSHKDIDAMRFVIDKFPNTDMVIHAGDHYSDAEATELLYPEISFLYVPGNCDLSRHPDTLSFDIEQKKFFVAHGHQYNVKSSYSLFEETALSRNVNIAIFGHTHIPYYNNNGRIILLNPGSIKHSRTFGVVEIYDGKLKADILDYSLWL